MNGLVILICILIIIVYLINVLIKQKYSYWKKKNVPYPEPWPILGNYAGYILQQEHCGQLLQKLCQQFPDSPYFGAYYGTEPVLVVQSPELLKHVLTKDFHFFHGREITNYETSEINTQNIFFASGDGWKVVRQNLTPMFSSAKMKNMFHLIEKCSHTFEDMLDRELSISDVIEAKIISARFTMDCACACTFGVESKTMTNPENNPFELMASTLFNCTTYAGFKMVCRSMWPAIFYGLGFKYYPAEIYTFFTQLLKNVFENRNYKQSPKNDFVDQLLNLKKEEVITCESIKNKNSSLEDKVQLRITDDLLVAQCISFFAAGFETSATTTSLTLYELAKNPEVQKHAAEEVDEYLRRHDNKLGYECINELPYLTACMYETIRKYPLLGHITREVMEDCTLPGGLRLEKGLRIHIPVHSLHNNRDCFPEPEMYQPERFVPENMINVKPYTFMPFGEGPRNCIGQRFAKMQVLSGLISFLKKYQVELADGMPKTLRLEGRNLTTQPRDQGLFLKVSKRQGWEQRMFVRT